MAITRTTLGAAITSNDTREIKLASTSGLSAGQFLVVGEEVMQVNGVPVAGTAKVQRGVAGTAAQNHSSGEAADFGDAGDFGAFGARQVDGSGRGGGQANRGAKIYTAAGAISIQDGLHVLDTAGTAFTLAAPTAEDVGKRLTIVGNQAVAYVITATSLLRGDSPTDDTTATFGATNLGNLLELVVLPDLVYGIVQARAVTLT
jgi:hypothetical protein